jgi:hypothetical protein
VATALGGVIVGLVVGMALAGDEFDPVDSGERLDAIMIEAGGSLEVAAVEYEESVADGEVTKQAEFDGALAAVASSRSKFAEVSSALTLIFPAQVEVIEDLYDDVEDAMESRADPADVTPLLEKLEAGLQGEVTVGTS